MVIETLEKIDQARVMVARLNYGEREWKLNHPPREDDPDMVIHEALRSAALEIARLTRELEAARAALTIAETTAANLHDTIRLRDRELDAALERERRLREAILAELHGADGVAVTEIGPDGVRRLWEALVQTEARDPDDGG